MDLSAILVPLVVMACYLGLAIVVLVKRWTSSRAQRYLLIYLLASAGWNAAFALSMASSSDSALTWIAEQVALGGLVILAVIFLNLTHAFLGRESRYTRVWWILGAVSLLIVVAFSPDLARLGLPPLTIGRLTIGQREIVQLFSVLAWGGFKLAAILATWRAFRDTASTVYRNRYRYWLLALALLIVGDLLFATMQPFVRFLGAIVNLVSAVVAMVAILRTQLVDIKTLYRQAFGYVTVALFMVAVNLLTIGIASTVAPPGQQFLAVWIGVGVTSVVFAFVVSPARRAIQRFVDRHLFHVTADYGATLRVYRDRVVERLRLDSLAELVVDTLAFAMDVRRGGLYLVREGKREIGGLQLHLVQREGDLPGGDYEVHAGSVLATRLASSSVPLTQYEIDVQDAFASLPSSDRNWLRALEIELLVPIHARNRLVGLIVLGAKGSGESYAASDIEWLGAMATQTAVALENAALFDQVERMSVRVMRLNADLERAYSQLKQVDRLKSAFIGAITHELRSPFAAASLSVELLRRFYHAGMTGQEMQQQIEQIDKELTLGRRMIDSLISFASLLSKQGDLHLESTDIAELVHTVLAPLQQVAESRSITLSCNCSAQLAPTQVDRERLAEAIHHLAHNAIKFNAEGGKVDVSCWATDTHVVLKVEDTGQGIPADKLANIWEAFTQAADDVRRGIEGLGLGLALVKFVVEAHQGEVWASSMDGQGSTFGFRIPRDLDVSRPASA